MRLAILTNNANSFPRIMAEGLARICHGLGVECLIDRSGWRWMKRRAFHRLGRQRIGPTCARAWRQLQRARFSRFIDVDAIVVVGHSPRAFERDFIDDELIRTQLPTTPIILYDLVFLGDQPWWVTRLRESGNFGLDRYDWYLTASLRATSEATATRCTHVGLHLDDGSLYPDQRRRFLALLDFRREAHVKERDVQVEALRTTGTSFVELRGHYSVSAIRSIYRQTAIYFVAHGESFGLPIVELQACGAIVLTPYADWCHAHQILDAESKQASRRLTANFVVYDNLQGLQNRIQQLKDDFDPFTVRQRFLRAQPSFYYGSKDGVRDLIDALRSGLIHSRWHRKHGRTSASV